MRVKKEGDMDEKTQPCGCVKSKGKEEEGRKTQSKTSDLL
jgi:hypothetical protein